MVYSLGYRRPQRVTSNNSLNGVQKQQSINDSLNSGTSSLAHGIPEALSFDRIISGGTCPPCTTRDFMNYLKYIEHDAENLQFFLWYRDYVQRFDKLSANEKVLAPEWTVEQAEAIAANAQQAKSNKFDAKAEALLRGTDFASLPKIAEAEKKNPFHTPPRAPSSNEDRRGDTPSDFASTIATLDVSQPESGVSGSEKTQDVFEDAGVKIQPFTVQPFREEISRIITTYVADGAPRQLNLSSKERAALLHALASTTHPSTFRDVMATVEWSLRCQAHPNFIRWTICNGNRPRVIFARGLGVSVILLAIVADLLITLSSAGRAWRVLPLVGYVIGVSTLIAAWKGMCVVLHGMHHRHLRPWELFTDDSDSAAPEVEKGAALPKDSMDTLGTSNSYEDEPWVPRYRKRNLVRKVFDREVWIQEPALRQIQDTIFVQSLLAAFFGGFVLVGIFCAVPHGYLY